MNIETGRWVATRGARIVFHRHHAGGDLQDARLTAVAEWIVSYDRHRLIEGHGIARRPRSDARSLP